METEMTTTDKPLSELKTRFVDANINSDDSEALEAATAYIAALERQLAEARKQFSDHHRAEVDHRKMIEGQLADWKERAEKAERELAKAESLYQMAVRGRKDIREAFKREREEAKSLRSRLAALENECRYLSRVSQKFAPPSVYDGDGRIPPEST